MMTKEQTVFVICGLTLIILGLFWELQLEKQNKVIKYLPCPRYKQFLC